MYDYIKSLLEQEIQESIILERPKNKDFGHYATPIAFSLAKKLGKPPKQIADELCAKLQAHKAFEKVENMNGYINLTLHSDVLDTFLTEALTKSLTTSPTKPQSGESTQAHINLAHTNQPNIEPHTTSNHTTSSHTEPNQSDHTLQDSANQPNTESKKESILLEYVSANPTGPLHIGHARGAVFGDSLRRVGRYLGFDIQTEYYINDAGSQIGMLGLSIMLAGRESILHMEVDYPQDYYKGEYIVEIANLAKERFGEDVFRSDENLLVLAEFGKDLMLEEIKSNLLDVGIEFDQFVSEKSLFREWEETLKILKSNNGTYQKDGKIWLASSQHNDQKDRVIVREDGEPTYLAGDIVYHRYKFVRDFGHYINIWGADHHGYIARVRAAIAFLGYDDKKLEVLLTQMVSLLRGGEPYKMSKRAGNFILMRDVVADIGSDALRFVFLSKKPDTHLEFDVDDLKKQDNSNPVFYINYANARIHTLIQKSRCKEEDILEAKLESEKQILDLLFLALQLPRVVQMSWEEKSLQKICEYLKFLASEFHAFYNATRILESPKETQYLKVCKMVSLSLTQGLELLGITAKTKM
ncbi:arginine--tRNA ligase [uncultured Helicobacter sp.]|uniref:arginine--tRNA ligase n=1 Tax=uncultured Helicobacter sp. TaxID=175537 RepID=UPI0027DC2204|nr:arginine--tRNA ligase [uncultured Helicobacter sp.]